MKTIKTKFDFCLLLLTQYLPPHHFRPLSILFAELENTINTVQSTFFLNLITLPSASPFTVLPLVWKGTNLTEQLRQNRAAKINNTFDTIHDRFNNHLNDVTIYLLNTHRFLREVFLNNW